MESDYDNQYDGKNDISNEGGEEMAHRPAAEYHSETEQQQSNPQDAVATATPATHQQTEQPLVTADTPEAYSNGEHHASAMHTMPSQQTASAPSVQSTGAGTAVATTHDTNTHSTNTYGAAAAPSTTISPYATVPPSTGVPVESSYDTQQHPSHLSNQQPAPAMGVQSGIHPYYDQPTYSTQPSQSPQPPHNNQIPITTPPSNTPPSQPNDHRTTQYNNNNGLNNHKVAVAIIGSGLFLTIVICIGIFLYYPTAPATDLPTVSTAKPTESIDSIDLLQDRQPIPTIPSTLPEVIINDIDTQFDSVVANQPNTQFDAQSTPSVATADDSASATLQNRPTAQSGTDLDRADTATTTPPTGRIISQRKPGVTTAQKITPSAAPALSSSAASRTTTTSPSAPAPAELYWIQVVSAQNRDSVEQAHVLLSQHQINGVVSKISDDRGTFYRLRIGPFANYQEANKFNQWFSTTTTFDNSFIVTVKNG